MGWSVVPLLHKHIIMALNLVQKKKKEDIGCQS